MSDTIALSWRQYRLERRMFWRNPSAAFFNFVLPLVILAGAGAALSGNQHQLDKLVPMIAGMSVMLTTFTALAYNIVFLRERGVLKRIHGTPLPTISYFGGVAANAVTNTAMQIAIVVLAGRVFFGIGWPQQWGALVVFVLVGVVCFAALGVAFAHAIPNFEFDRRVRQRGVPASGGGLLLRLRLLERPRLRAHDRRRAAAEAADRRPLRRDGDRLHPERKPRRARGDRAVGRVRAVLRSKGLLVGAAADVRRHHASRHPREPDRT